MRCLTCRAEMERDDYACAQCGRRPFTWLGDPFGTRELPSARIATLPASPLAQPSRPASPMAGITAGKLISALLLILFSTFHSPILTLGLIAAVVLLLWRWPTMTTARFLFLLAVIAVAGLVAVPPARPTRPAGARSAGATLVVAAPAAAVASPADRAISLIDPRSNRVVGLIPTSRAPRELAFGDGALWVTSRADNTLTRIRP